jgi:hypothetical protein
MTLWIEEELFAENSEGGFETEGAPRSLGAFVRIHEPRVNVLRPHEVSSIHFTKPDHHYAIVKLGCPTELRNGTPQAVKLKLEPSIEVASTVKVGLGSMETDVLAGQVAPSVVGFKGDHEIRPYWNLEDNNQAPLYGIRHFWLLLEAPKVSSHCFISCVILTTLQTVTGPIHLGPKQKNLTHRPRYKIDFQAEQSG